MIGRHDKGHRMMFDKQIASFKKKDARWSASQVCPRRVESGLGGHENGVFGVDAGVEKASPPLMKRMRTTMSECTTFSGFTDVVNEIASEKPNSKDQMASNNEYRDTSSHLVFQWRHDVKLNEQEFKQLAFNLVMRG